MGGVSASGLRPRSLLGLCLLACLTLGCKCSRSPSNSPTPARVSTPSSTVAVPAPPPIEIETAFVAMIRARRFEDARSLLSGLAPDRAAQPSYRFVNAYLAVRTGNGAAALPLLANLEREIVDLLTEIERLRAEAQLQTADALVGAAWLDDHGRSDAWLEAARTLNRLDQRASALIAIDKGLGRANTRSKSRGKTLVAELRVLRVAIQSAAGDPSRLSEDLSWLATEAPAHPAAREVVAQALDTSRLRLEPGQQLQRLRRLADTGWVERADLELEKLPAATARLLSAGTRNFLRGRARQVARVQQVEGARLLERAAELKVDDATQCRFDAARLYVREGELSQALRVYDQLAQTERTRGEEAQFYAARAAAILGEPRRGIERFTRLIERSPRGRWRSLAEQERALGWLALGEPKLAEPQLARLASDPARREDQASLLELAGLGALLLGQRDVAAGRWKAVREQGPLTLAGAFAAARLKEVGEPAPSLQLESPPPLQNEQPTLSRRTEQLLAFGIGELAADAYTFERTHASGRGSVLNIQRGCAGWAKVGYGERGYAVSRTIRDEVDLTQVPNQDSRWKWECRFPRPYASIVDEIETEYRLPPYLLHAVMRQESGFDPDIMSPVGAVGLLQLMPQTANRLAEELGLGGELRLEEPRTSIRLGAAYLRKLLDFFAQDLVLAVAAYNAGPKAVALWQSYAGTGSVELFAARIPYAETQKYVERVISNLLVYRTLYGPDRDFAALSLSLPQELKDRAGLY